MDDERLKQLGGGNYYQALEEAVVNSLYHRDWTIREPVCHHRILHGGYR